MALDNGIYIIACKANNSYVGRFPVEDLSLMPKQVFALPQGMQTPHLIVQKDGSGYIIKAGGAPLAAFRDSVFAFLIDMQPAESWVVTPQPQHGENIYTVEKADRSAGWVQGSEADQRGYPIRVSPLISTKSLPPQFPPNSLFTFIRVDRE